jgi:battenin
MANFIPSVWIVFGVILWEGLLGGATYVNAFNNISNEIDPVYREFSMGAAAGTSTHSTISMNNAIRSKWKIF